VALPLPAAGVPYEQLVSENRRRSRQEPEFELLDTGVFDDDRYWVVETDYAKADPTDLRVRVRLTNTGPEPATIHVLPTVWYRNTWSWDEDGVKPRLASAGDAAIGLEHERLGPMVLQAAPAPDGSLPEQLYCENETNAERLFGSPSTTRYPKDGINDHVVHGAATVNPAREGTKAAFRYRVTVQPGETAELSLRLASGEHHDAEPGTFGRAFDDVLARRRAEADAFYAELTPPGTSAEDAMIMRQGFAGMIWGKQFYHYDVDRWLSGDPAQPPPRRPAVRAQRRLAAPGRRRHHVHARPVGIPLVRRVGLGLPLRRARPPRPGLREVPADPAVPGMVPAPERGDPRLRVGVRGPQPAGAGLGGAAGVRRRRAARHRVPHPDLLQAGAELHLVGQPEDAEGNNLFEGGFLGLDNIGPIDRSHLPAGHVLQQSDATAWMAFYCLNLLEMAGSWRSTTRPWTTWSSSSWSTSR